MNTSSNVKPVYVDRSVNTGVEKRDRAELAGALSAVLSDSYILYLKTQNFHWNIVGPMFYGVHKLTEEQYQDMAEAIDTIAERIRAIGFNAPGSFKQFLELSTIDEETKVPEAKEMIAQLTDGNEKCARQLRIAVAKAEEYDDVKTADLLTERVGQHEENAWMLRSLLA